ncbi:hypothetical protein ACFQ51_52400 [Streptomyces kaempferi]
MRSPKPTTTSSRSPSDATDVYIRGELAYTWRPRRGQISWKTAALEANPDLDPEPYRGEDTRTLNIVMEQQ